MELQELTGKHYLSGVDYGNETFENYGTNDDRQYVIFILDGIKYMASEDPEDGYRSCMNDLEVTEEKVGNTFKPLEVTCKMRSDDKYEVNE